MHTADPYSPVYIPGLQNLDPSRLQQTAAQSLASQPVDGEQMMSWAYGLDDNWLNLFKPGRGPHGVLLVISNRRFLLLHPSATDNYTIKSIESLRFDEVTIRKRKKPSTF